jgi:anti-anti-sigma factor
MTSGTTPHLTLRTVADTGVARVVVSGDLDAYTADSLVDHVIREVPPGPVLVLDLSGVPFCDSHGVRGLLAIRHHCDRNDMRLRLVQLTPTVHRLLVGTLGLGPYLDVRDDDGTGA